MSDLKARPIERVSVVGAGTMGHGIALLAAQSGLEVCLFDVRPQIAQAGLEKIRSALDKRVSKGKLSSLARDRALERLRLDEDLEKAVVRADLVIEAVPEEIEIKCELFKTLDQECHEETLLASNTSSLSITRIAEATRRPEQVLGLHFFNPPAVMKLLEIVRGEKTSPATLATAREVARRMGKEAIVVRDTPGFATSRLGLTLGLEAMRMLEEGVATAEDVDRAMELGYGHPMGPLRVSDLVGLDIRLSIAETLQRELSAARFEPPDILKRKVREGKLGKKSGEGFYRWPER